MSVQTAEEHRRYIRHPAGVPITVRDRDGTDPHAAPGLNVSHGGLAFTAQDPLEPGRTIQIRIDEVVPPFEAKARVAWCRTHMGGYMIGVEFLDAKDAFRSRMVQQVCAIEQFQREMSIEEGRPVSRAEAASVWVERNAASFPQA